MKYTAPQFSAGSARRRHAGRCLLPGQLVNSAIENNPFHPHGHIIRILSTFINQLTAAQFIGVNTVRHVMLWYIST
jgi:hypothetical protein